jgi:hypothetical protein
MSCDPWIKVSDRLPRIGRKVLIWRAGWDCAPLAAREKTLDDLNGGYFVGWQLADEYFQSPNAIQEGFIGWNEDKDADAMPTHWQPRPPEPA